MKRCPQCRRIEVDDALAFCRADGSPLARESGAVGEVAGTLRLGPTAAAGDTETRILPQETSAAGEFPSGATASTTVPAGRRASGSTQDLSKPKTRRVTIIAGAALLAVTLAAYGYYRLAPHGGTMVSSVAVLPFQNASGDPNAEYLSDGLAESLINSLSQLQQLKVIARPSAFRYKGKDLDLAQVARELNVQAVINGRVVQRGDVLSISVELIDARNNAQLWGKQFTRKSSDIFALQEDITRQVTDSLRVRLMGEQRERLTKRYTDNEEAYKLYLQGRYFWNRRSVEDFKTAIPFFQKAIELDSDFALAYSGLSDSYNLLGQYQGGAPPKEVMPLAKGAALKALSLDEHLAEAHGSLGQYLIEYEYDWAGAEREFKRAIELNPNYASAYQWHAEQLMWEGRFEEAQKQARRAVELDPLSRIINSELARVALFARRYDEAIMIFKKNIELSPNWHGDYNYLWYAYAAKGMYAEAVDAYIKLMTFAKLAPPSEIQATQESFATSGWQGFLRHRVRYLEESSRREYVSPTEPAELYAYLGEKDQAFASLEKAYEIRVGDLKELKHKSSFDNLRDDPRFSNILRRVGLAQ
ncbi:MAG: hypothetical protein H0V18_14850 [Pyrinomonadaceae bacterium]|nr:hypothetical protein [Pyrinomonadaceae bacterium]